MQKIINISDLGEVIIKKFKNSKSEKLFINKKGTIVVSIPFFVPYSEGENFLKKNINWVRQQLCKVEKKIDEKKFTPDSIFITRKHELKFIAHDYITAKGNIRENIINISYNPITDDFQNNDFQKFIIKVIAAALKKEANEYIIPRFENIAKNHNFKYKSVKIGNAKTRWGCCDKNNNIILSNSLILLQDNLIDFIIFHELCHIVHKNHSKEFHSLLDKLLNGNEKEYSKQINNFSIEIKPGNYRY